MNKVLLLLLLFLYFSAVNSEVYKTIDEDDVRSQKALLSDYFSAKGHDKEFIEEIADKEDEKVKE